MDPVFFKVQAVERLRPGKTFVYRNGIFEWNDEGEPPTEAEIDAEADELEAAYNATQYQRDRKPEYPDLADLADALYWSNQGDNTKLDEYYEKVSAVKTKYPKP